MSNSSSSKTNPPKNIDEYISQFPLDVQAVLEKLRGLIQNAAPEASEAISYQIPAFTFNGTLVSFAAFKKHIGFYPTPTAIEKFSADLAQYEFAKGSVKFPLSEKIPAPLIKKMVKFRVKEMKEAASQKRKTK